MQVQLFERNFQSSSSTRDRLIFIVVFLSKVEVEAYGAYEYVGRVNDDRYQLAASRAQLREVGLGSLADDIDSQILEHDTLI